MSLMTLALLGCVGVEQNTDDLQDGMQEGSQTTPTTISGTVSPQEKRAHYDQQLALVSTSSDTAEQLARVRTILSELLELESDEVEEYEELLKLTRKKQSQLAMVLFGELQPENNEDTEELDQKELIMMTHAFFAGEFLEEELSWELLYGLGKNEESVGEWMAHMKRDRSEERAKEVQFEKYLRAQTPEKLREALQATMDEVQKWAEEERRLREKTKRLLELAENGQKHQQRYQEALGEAENGGYRKELFGRMSSKILEALGEERSPTEQSQLDSMECERLDKAGEVLKVLQKFAPDSLKEKIGLTRTSIKTVKGFIIRRGSKKGISRKKMDTSPKAYFGIDSSNWDKKMKDLLGSVF